MCCSSLMWTQSLDSRQSVQLTWNSNIGRKQKQFCFEDLQTTKVDIDISSLFENDILFNHVSDETRFLLKNVFKISLLKLNSCFQKTKVSGQFWEVENTKSKASRFLCSPRRREELTIFWQPQTRSFKLREWAQCSEGDKSETDVLSVSRLALWWRSSSGHWWWNAGARWTS